MPWEINRTEPVSLDYIPAGKKYKYSAYQIIADQLKTQEQQRQWLEHLREKIWFNEIEFLDALCDLENERTGISRE